MKVYEYQIEVMWLFLATMFCPTTKEIEFVYTYNNEREVSIFKDIYSPKIIRPPPSGGGC